MGNVCCNETTSEIDDREERSRILDDNSENDYLTNSQAQDNISYGSFNNFGNNSQNNNFVNNSKSIEQSALDRIYQKMARNVIDVAPGESIVIQQAECIERQKVYQAKLNQIKMQFPSKLNPNIQISSSRQQTNHNQHVPDVTTNYGSPSSNSIIFNNMPSGQSNFMIGHQKTNQQLQEKRRVDYEPISSDEIRLINDITARTAKAIKNLRIITSEQVVAQFKP